MALSYSTCLFGAGLDGSLLSAGENDGGVISREERRPAEEAA